MKLILGIKSGLHTALMTAADADCGLLNVCALICCFCWHAGDGAADCVSGKGRPGVPAQCAHVHPGMRKPQGEQVRKQ